MSAPSGTAVVYVCGYVRSFDGRSYLLPVGARIERPSDLLAQGVSLSALRSAPIDAGAAHGLVLLDLVPAPGEGSLPGLDDLRSRKEETLGVVAAVEPAGDPDSEPTATPLAAAAAKALADPQADTGQVISTIQTAYGPDADKLVVSAPAMAPHSEQPTSEQPVQPAAPPPATSTSPPAPVEPPVDLGTDAGRRRIQVALQKLGYYPGRIDGRVGPDTQAAIRWLQFELHHDLTGHLKPDEVIQLLARGG